MASMPNHPIQVRYRTALRPVATPPNPTPLPEIDPLLPAARLKRFQAYSQQLRTRLHLLAACDLASCNQPFWVPYRTALPPGCPPTNHPTPLQETSCLSTVTRPQGV